jgi:glycerol-3-phosphate dehydrogenase
VNREQTGHNLNTAVVYCVLQGSKLSDVINSRHENPKYLPGISLGSNVIADPDLESAVSECGCVLREVMHNGLGVRVKG